MNNLCIACLERPRFKGTLCGSCREKYGKYKNWPEWLKFSHDDTIREVRENKIIAANEVPLELDGEEIGHGHIGSNSINRRSTLLETYDDRGYTNLRGCREEAFALIGGKEPDYADGN